MKGKKKIVNKGKKNKGRVVVDEKQRKQHVEMNLDEFGLGESDKLRMEKEAAEQREREEEEKRKREQEEQEQEEEEEEEEVEEEPKKRGKKGKKFIDVCFFSSFYLSL